jgi:serine/threonine-protein kinase
MLISETLGPYRVLDKLGEGGMGEVYRATDTKLKRHVAIKILPPAVAGDPDRLARFQREAEVLAALNHPNIAGIYGLEESGGITGLVMELVEGEDLSERVARGAIHLDEALPIARQIAEALEAAHEQGIIHRDLKPANIKVRDDGTVKVLDFGLAKAVEPAGVMSSSTSMSPTITTPAITGVGIILGTAAYMSPEQARGKIADKRSDIWAFGCVLYELLTAKRAFDGDDVSDTMAAVLRVEPDWSALPASLPQPIALMLRRCLEKDRRRRVGDVSTIRFLLNEQATLTPLAEADPHAAAEADRRVRPFRWTALAAVVGLIAIGAALGAAGVWYARPRGAAPLVMRFNVPLGEGQNFTTTTDLDLALSPDGSKVVYVANRRLYLRSMSDVDAQPIRGTDVNPRHPTFSPDGASVAYFSADERTLKRIAITGGAPVTICSLAEMTPLGPLGGSWHGDTILFGVQGVARSGIGRVAASGGKPELLIEADANAFADAPQMLPDGDHVLFTLARTAADRWDRAQIVVQSLKTGERRTLVDAGSDGRFLKSGHLLYAIGGVVFAVRFNPATLQVQGAPIPIIEGARRGFGSASTQTGIAQYTVADTGTLAYIPGPLAAGPGQETIVLLDRAGTSQPLKVPKAAYREPRISANGKQLAVGTDDGKEAIVWVYDLDGTSAIRRLTLGGRSRYPVWSPDGRQIAFQSDREGDAAIFVQRTDMSGAVERLTKPEQGVAHVPESWSPDGKHLLFSASKDGANFSSFVLSLPDRKATPFNELTSARPINATFSPDGRWVAYTWAPRAEARPQIYVQRFPPAGTPYQISKETQTSPHHPFWSRDGKELYYIPGPTQFAVVTINTSSGFSFSEPVQLSRGAPPFTEGGPTNTRQNDSAADKRIVGIVSTTGQAVSGSSAEVPIRVVLNWFDELNARLPIK